MVRSPAKPLSDSRGGVDPLWAGTALGASTAAHCQVAHLVEEHGALQRVHLRDVRGKFGQERIAENRRSLFMAPAARITKEVANVDLERRRQPGQRRQRWHCLA